MDWTSGICTSSGSACRTRPWIPRSLGLPAWETVPSGEESSRREAKPVDIVKLFVLSVWIRQRANVSSDNHIIEIRLRSTKYPNIVCIDADFLRLRRHVSAFFELCSEKQQTMPQHFRTWTKSSLHLFQNRKLR